MSHMELMNAGMRRDPEITRYEVSQFDTLSPLPWLGLMAFFAWLVLLLIVLLATAPNRRRSRARFDKKVAIARDAVVSARLAQAEESY